MMQIGLIGAGAGAAAGLLFASVSSGSWFAVILFYLAPLPIMIAGLGWTHWAALVAAVTGALAVGSAFGTVYFFAFLAGAGVPAVTLTYLALLARPAGSNGSATLEWYPAGRLVAWAAVLGALVVMVAIPNFGIDGEGFRAGLSRALTDLLRPETGDTSGAPLTMPGVSDPQRLIDFLVEAIPPAAAVIATLTNIVNLWLAARVVSFSGRLTRPMPVLSAMTFPRSVTGALGLAIVMSFFPGIIGVVAGVLAASLLIAHGIIGFAVLHAITHGMNARGFLLGGVYAAVMVFGWPMLALCMLGILDIMIDLRARFAGRGGPPAPT